MPHPSRRAGWLAYPPLSELSFSPGVGVDYYLWSLQISGIGSLLKAATIKRLDASAATYAMLLLDRAGIDQTINSRRPEYDHSGSRCALALPARNHHAKTRVPQITGTMTTSMIIVASKSMVRSEPPMGPCGSRTPPLQAPRMHMSANAAPRPSAMGARELKVCGVPSRI
jgi:hypothetical protein